MALCSSCTRFYAEISLACLQIKSKERTKRYVNAGFRGALPR
ncbi:hypothetical protein BRCON_0267 [Candidatus Sumerlaea chitinivorans]|uniref:Uncharacterized protein n=1 Tax=Sumerlaea chitinivorans TaxID=2250252 RepID=A0A2Z4Y1Z1_SUMC1|nr:hypothetical protein BRCON_0267 [Candidatus Sumerlaea chitinivorans]